MAGMTDSKAAAQASRAKGGAPEFYVWRQYVIRAGTQPRRLADYLQGALIPAANRLGHAPIGVFEPVAGVPSPTVFTLTPSPTLDAVGAMEAALQKDEQYARAAAPYLDALATDPVYTRIETSILAAFPNVPRVEVPAATAGKGPRLFELRTYESHNEAAGAKKIEMFEKGGEIAIFRRLGLTPVFFGRDVIGTGLPSLTYMLVYPDAAARDKSWAAFRDDPEWVKLRTTPGYANADIMTNIQSLYLQPGESSQI
jgi:hypothetical protein